VLVHASSASRLPAQGATSVTEPSSGSGWQISHAQRPIPASTGTRRYGMDLDRFLLHELPPTSSVDERIAQVRAAGVDLIVDDNPDAPALYLIEMPGSLVKTSTYDQMSPKLLLAESITARTRRFPERDRPRNEKDWIEASRPLQVVSAEPRTLLFHTREGGVGILQVLGRDPDSNAIKVRYKLARAGHTPGTNATTRPASEAAK